MKKFFNEFKEFITRGNVLDMAIGVIIATAFGKITTSLNLEVLYLLANCIITLKNNLFPYCCLLIICIIIMVFSFQGTSEPLRLIETLC